MAQLRMDKILADSGRWSRKEAKQLIKEGRVWLDGKCVASGDVKCDPNGSRITVDGNSLHHETAHYIMLHKPAGFLSATEDRHAETVLNLLPKELQKLGLFPVGRLDKDTEGLLLLTDDGELAHRLLSPKHHVDKVYYARTDGAVTAEHVSLFEEGLQLGDGMKCMPAKLEILSSGTESEVLVTVQEGKFHQVKRMLACVGAPVLYLKRLSMGTLKLDETLAPGEWRNLTKEEEKNLLTKK